LFVVFGIALNLIKYNIIDRRYFVITVTIELPETVFDFIGKEPDDFVKEMRVVLLACGL
jgi:hypothetical protein